MSNGEKPPEPQPLFFLLSIVVPLAGIIIGAIYLGKADPGCKRFGRGCIIAAVSTVGLMCIFYIITTLSLGPFSSF